MRVWRVHTVCWRLESRQRRELDAWCTMQLKRRLGEVDVTLNSLAMQKRKQARDGSGLVTGVCLWRMAGVCFWRV